MTSYKEARQKVLYAFERAFIRKLLLKTGGNVSKAARMAGSTESTCGGLCAGPWGRFAAPSGNLGGRWSDHLDGTRGPRYLQEVPLEPR